MFALSQADLRRPILGCGDGPAGFNAELTRRGGTVISIDPIYRFDATPIEARVREVYDVVLEETRRNAHEFVWRRIPSVEALGELRLRAMRTFLEDFAAGAAQGRYLDAELPTLPFADRRFAVAVCSHFLFLYSEQLSAQFHVESIKELCRVAEEVRIFPLLELGSKQSRHLDAVVQALATAGYSITIETVPYEFQRGGDRLLRARAATDGSPARAGRGD